MLIDFDQFSQNVTRNPEHDLEIKENNITTFFHYIYVLFTIKTIKASKLLKVFQLSTNNSNQTNITLESEEWMEGTINIIASVHSKPTMPDCDGIWMFPKIVGLPNKPMGFPTKNDQHLGWRLGGTTI